MRLYFDFFGQVTPAEIQEYLNIKKEYETGPKRGFVLPYHKYTGPYNPLHEQLDEYDQPLVKQEPYNAVDAKPMRHDICYRDNDTKEGKQTCDDEMLKELDELEPRGIREKIGRKLVR